MGKKNIKSRCEIDTIEESYIYEGKFNIIKRTQDVPVAEQVFTGSPTITTYEICVERQDQLEGTGGVMDTGFCDCRIYLDEKDVPTDLLIILEKYSEVKK